MPATAREIGAYLCGARIRREWSRDLLTGSSWDRTATYELAKRLSDEDAEVMASMNEAEWWRFFWYGFERVLE